MPEINAAVPGSSFYKDFEDRCIRFRFAKKDETLHEADRRLLGQKALWAAHRTSQGKGSHHDR